MSMKALVVGASGPNAGLVVPALVARGVQVRALVRDLSRAEIARNRGAVETAIGDLTDPPSLRQAAAGVDSVFHVNPAFAPEQAAMGTAMVEAAKAAGVGKVVFSSVYHPSLVALRNHVDKQPVEAALYESGLTFVVLQPAMFMQNLIGAWRGALATGRVVMPYSRHVKTAYVDYRDVADVVATAVATDRLDNGTFELAAPGMVDRVTIAELMSGAAGRDIVADEISFAEWTQRVSMPAGPIRDGLEIMMRHYDEHGFAGGNGLVLEAVLGREPRSLAAFIAELAQSRPEK